MLEQGQPTETMVSKIKPAAEASKAATGEYTVELTDEEVRTTLALRNPTSCVGLAGASW